MTCFANRLCSPLLFTAISFCCSLLAGGYAGAQEPLVWKFTVNETQNYQMVQKMEMTMNLGPTGETKTTIEQTIDMTWKVESVAEDETGKLTLQIRRIQMDVSAAGQGEVHYDTASDDQPQGFAAMLAPTLNALASATFKMTVTSRGEITEMDIPESLLEAMRTAPGDAMMGELATEKGFKNLVQQSFLVLPEPGDLELGHQWTKSFELESSIAGKITTETTYRYEGPREINGQSLEVFAPTMAVSFGDRAGSELQVAEQKSSGEILFSRSAGWMESSVLHQQIDMTITVGDQEINQKMDQTVKFKHVPAE